MVENLSNVVQAKKMEIVSVAPYFLVSCDKVTTLDDQSWISIHVYMICDWERMSMLLTLEHITEGNGIANISKMIVDAHTNQGGLNPHQIRDRFMAFGADDASILQGKRNNIIDKLQVLSCATHAREALCGTSKQPSSANFYQVRKWCIG